MAKKNQQLLNLDEVFGATQELKVKWAGKTHFLTPPAELGARQIIEWERLTKRINAMAEIPEEEFESEVEELEQIEEVAIEALRVIGPTLPIEQIPFMARLRIISWYTEQISGEEEVEAGTNPKATGGE